MATIVAGKRPLENGDLSSSISPPRYKRRKVSAIRDFPEGCGPNAVRLISLKNEEGVCKQNEGDITRNVESSSTKDEDLCEGVKKAKSKENNETQSHAVANKIADDGANLPSCSLALPYYPMPSDFVWREPKYPPRRRVSAVRDFPVGCGRNVPKLGDIENDHAGQRERGSKSDIVVEPNNANIIGVEISGEIGADSIIDKVEGLVSEEADTLSSQGDKAPLSITYKLKGQEESSEEKPGGQNDKDFEQSKYNRNDERDILIMSDELDKGLIVYVKDKNKRKKSIGVPCINVGLQEKSRMVVGNGDKMIIVQGLMSALHCPWREDKGALKGTPSTAAVKKKVRLKEKGTAARNSGTKKVIKEGLMSDSEGVAKGTPTAADVKQIEEKKNCDFSCQDACNLSANKSKDDNQKIVGKSMGVPYTEEDIVEASRPLGTSDKDDSSDNDDLNDFQLLPRRRSFDVSLPPFGASSSSERGVRRKVRETLRLFQALCRKLLQEEEKLTKDQVNESKRTDLQAAKILKDRGMYVNTKKVIGSVPGVEVGDIFNYRTELAIVGLHGPLQGGIDTIKLGKETVAISIVASGGYANEVESSDVLIYTGQGGNASGKDKQPEDQKLEKGNLALKNCIDKKTLVRVIRGFKETKPPETPGGRSQKIATYTYDGLYTVDRYYHDLGSHGKLVYKFELNRVPGQPELAWKEVKQSKKHAAREGRCVADISGGEEKIPISVVNTIDDEAPPQFTYITSMMYPDWCQPIPSKGCECKSGCSDSKHCACALKNGGEIPFNHNGAIVQAKPLVYECGPLCKCPPSCYNRVSQHGIKLPLEVFKTNSMGWGVRCLSAISSGSFICEYVGELLDDKEAEQRTGSDEYLFDIGQNYNDTSLWDGLTALLPDLTSNTDSVIDVGFTIDAARHGNIGRFINHSCSPNLYAQNVLYDHEDKRVPHIMFFAAENIPPLQELTYHYNYTIDQVYDSEGNIKKKSCYCGSAECSGRMY